MPKYAFKCLYLLSCYLIIVCNLAYAIDLQDVYQQALVNDPLFRQAAANKRAILEDRPQAMAGYLPTVDVSADIAGTSTKRSGTSRFVFGDTGLDETDRTNSDSLGYSLNLTQPIIRADRYFRIKQSDKTIMQADAELAASELDLAIRVSTVYFNVLSAIDNLNFAEAELRSLSRQLEQAKQRFDVGLTAVTDVQEAQAGYDRAIAEEIRAENDIDNAREALREITGNYIYELDELSDSMPLLNPEPDNIDAWSEMALSENLNVIAAIHSVDIARDEIHIQRSGHYPTVDFNARSSYNESDTSGNSETTNNQISLQLNVPIYSGGAVSSRVRASQERLNQQLEHLELVRRQAYRQTRESFLGVISGISQIKALQQAVVSSEAALEATQAGFEVGTRTAVDVVQAERSTFQARRDLARERYDYITNTLILKQAAGILTSDDIEKVTEWLE